MTERLLVTLCTFNECENIERIIPEIRAIAPDADILVVDDNSPDGTGRLADEFAGRDEHVKVVHREGKQGLGTAIIAGMTYGVEHGYDFVLNMDADFSHHPRHIPAIHECMNRVDVGIGSRYVPGGRIEGWGFLRHFMSRGVNWYARLLLGLKTRDNSGSFRCYRSTRLAQIDFERIRSRGYSFQEEILFRCRQVGCTFEETPIVFEDRRYGESKISPHESFSALWVLFRIAVERVLPPRAAPADG